jgi:hypothetical protein
MSHAPTRDSLDRGKSARAPLSGPQEACPACGVGLRGWQRVCSTGAEQPSAGAGGLTNIRIGTGNSDRRLPQTALRLAEEGSSMNRAGPA